LLLIPRQRRFQSDEHVSPFEFLVFLFAPSSFCSLFIGYQPPVMFGGKIKAEVPKTDIPKTDTVDVPDVPLAVPEAHGMTAWLSGAMENKYVSPPFPHTSR
jgi:hypothetical protein